ncbi:HD domain-containing protein [Candidatus Falkowbacteria bacterium]|nr:HD domain-containing protein [Candidatus Falkowbacteria bacterium]
MDTSEKTIGLDSRLALFLYGFAKGGKLKLTTKAVTFAMACHKNETRDNGELYINHPLAACNSLIYLGVEDDAILAAVILHDVVENGHATLEEVRAEFGDRVALLVDNQTKRKTADGKEKTEEYYARIASDIGSVLGKGADRLNNISNMVQVFKIDRVQRYVKETEEYVLTMLKDDRYTNLGYTDVMVCLYDTIRNLVRVTKKYIESELERQELKKRLEELQKT